MVADQLPWRQSRGNNLSGAVNEERGAQDASDLPKEHVLPHQSAFSDTVLRMPCWSSRDSRF